MSQSVTLTIDRLAAGGDGIARHDGLAVFVPRTVPGDVVRVALQPQKTFARGRVLEVLTPSPDRVAPRCTHYTADHCGGCQVQGMGYEAQVRAKGAIIRDALERIAKRPMDDVRVEASTAPFQYRNAITVTVQVDRARPEGFVAGFHVLGDPSQVFPLTTCHLAAEDVMACFTALRPHLGGLPRARTLRLTVRRLDELGRMALHVDGGSKWDRRAADALLQAVPSLAACWWTPTDGARRLMTDRDHQGAAGASFAQVNPAVAARLQAHVLSLVDRRPETHAIDAYAGTGTLTVALAARGMRVTAIELDAEATAVAASRLQGVPGARVLTGRVEQHLADALPASLVVLNPPRGGVHERVPAMLAGASVARIIYVSCDPATLARDIGRLGPRWQVTDILGFDMFPQTAHVETVCLLEERTA